MEWLVKRSPTPKRVRAITANGSRRRADEIAERGLDNARRRSTHPLRPSTATIARFDLRELDGVILGYRIEMHTVPKGKVSHIEDMGLVEPGRKDRQILAVVSRG